jgi:nitroreductase
MTMSVEEAIVGRRSIRAFDRGRSVPRGTIERLLAIAGRAPSGSNIQPWRVWVLQGRTRELVCRALQALHDSGAPSSREYEYYLQRWREPYYARRKECGVGLYRLLGLAKEDRAGMHAQHGRNYDLFGAPVGLIVTIERDMEKGAWLDCGMFIQSVMLAARGLGLETCPQAAIAHHQIAVRTHMKIPDTEIVLCGIALGYPEAGALVNTYRTTRIPLAEFVTWTE